MLHPVKHDSYQTAAGRSPLNPTLHSVSFQSLTDSRLGRHATDDETRLRIARRIFGLIPLLVFLLTLALFAGQAEQSLTGFAHAILRVIAASLSSSLVCIGAYGFYKYLQGHSHGL